MANQPYAQPVLEEALRALQEAGSKQAAADRLGIPVSTFKDRLKRAEAHGLYVPIPEAPEMAVQPVSKPRVRVRAVTSETPPEGPVYRVVAIGDLHDSPGQSKNRFRWIGRYIAKTNPDRVVQIGDWGTFDSMSMHDAPGSVRSNERPSFAQDLESLEDSIAAMDEGMAGWAGQKDITLGNHEERIWRAANGDPKRLGDAPLRLEQVFARWNWKTHLYGEWLFVGGVGLTHVPRNLMGREYGGKRVENQIGNDAMFSVIFGHSHRRGFWTFPKIGPLRGIDILNLGSAMENNHIENYARLSTTGWSYGAYDLTIQSGRIISDKFISMIELERDFGD